MNEHETTYPHIQNGDATASNGIPHAASTSETANLELLHALFDQLKPRDVEQFHKQYQLWSLQQLRASMVEQMDNIRRKMSENEDVMQQFAPSALALANLAQFQTYGVEDVDLLDTMLDRGDRWLDHTMQLLDRCERLDLIGGDYTEWCQHALEGAYDWLDSMDANASEDSETPTNVILEPQSSAETETLSQATEELLLRKLMSEDGEDIHIGEDNDLDELPRAADTAKIPALHSPRITQPLPPLEDNATPTEPVDAQPALSSIATEEPQPAEETILVSDEETSLPPAIAAEIEIDSIDQAIEEEILAGPHIEEDLEAPTLSDQPEQNTSDPTIQSSEEVMEEQENYNEAVNAVETAEADIQTQDEETSVFPEQEETVETGEPVSPNEDTSIPTDQISDGFEVASSETIAETAVIELSSEIEIANESSTEPVENESAQEESLPPTLSNEDDATTSEDATEAQETLIEPEDEEHGQLEDTTSPETIKTDLASQDSPETEVSPRSLEDEQETQIEAATSKSEEQVTALDLPDTNPQTSPASDVTARLPVINKQVSTATQDGPVKSSEPEEHLQPREAEDHKERLQPTEKIAIVGRYTSRAGKQRQPTRDLPPALEPHRVPSQPVASQTTFTQPEVHFGQTIATMPAQMENQVEQSRPQEGLYHYSVDQMTTGADTAKNVGELLSGVVGAPQGEKKPQPSETKPKRGFFQRLLAKLFRR